MSDNYATITQCWSLHGKLFLLGNLLHKDDNFSESALGVFLSEQISAAVNSGV